MITVASIFLSFFVFISYSVITHIDPSESRFFYDKAIIGEYNETFQDVYNAYPFTVCQAPSFQLSGYVKLRKFGIICTSGSTAPNFNVAIYRSFDATTRFPMQLVEKFDKLVTISMCQAPSTSVPTFYDLKDKTDYYELDALGGSSFDELWVCLQVNISADFFSGMSGRKGEVYDASTFFSTFPQSFEESQFTHTPNADLRVMFFDGISLYKCGEYFSDQEGVCGGVGFCADTGCMCPPEWKGPYCNVTIKDSCNNFLNQHAECNNDVEILWLLLFAAASVHSIFYIILSVLVCLFLLKCRVKKVVEVEYVTDDEETKM